MECPTCGSLCKSIAYDRIFSTETFSNGNKTVKTEQAIKSSCCHAQISWIDDADVTKICDKMIANKTPKNSVIQQITKLGYLEIDAEMAVNTAKVNTSFS